LLVCHRCSLSYFVLPQVCSEVIKGSCGFPGREGICKWGPLGPQLQASDACQRH